jgi:hypothetical protein
VVVAVLVVGATNPGVVVVDGGIENIGALDVFVIIGNAVVAIGWARRLESALFADEVVGAVAVVTGRKLVEVGGNGAVVVAAVDVGNEKGALVVVVAVVVDGVENGNAGIVVVEATVVVAGVGNENEGID